MEKTKREKEMEMAKKEFDRLFREVEKKETIPLPLKIIPLIQNGWRNTSCTRQKSTAAVSYISLSTGIIH